MLTRPRRIKYAKAHKGRVNPLYKNNQNFKYGEWGLIALEAGRITASQIAASSLALKRKIRKEGKIWFRIFPHIPVSGKPSEVRMGKGKGSIHYWMARVRPGSFIVELTTSNRGLALFALKVAQDKLPIKTQIVNVTGNTSRN